MSRARLIPRRSITFIITQIMLRTIAPDAHIGTYIIATTGFFGGGCPVIGWGFDGFADTGRLLFIFEILKNNCLTTAS